MYKAGAGWEQKSANRVAVTVPIVWPLSYLYASVDGVDGLEHHHLVQREAPHTHHLDTGNQQRNVAQHRDRQNA